jgi:dCTP deaminase
MLTGPEIKKQIAEGKIGIEPFNPAHVGPNSVDLTLSPELLVYEKQVRFHHRCEQMQARHRLQTRKVEAGESDLLWAPLTQASLDAWPQTMEPLDMKVEEKAVSLRIPEEGFVLYPGVIYLGATAEVTKTPEHVPCLEGRSSVARLGIFTHVTAGFGDVGFEGSWTLEMVVPAPVRIYAGVRVCQIFYSQTTGELMAYRSPKYQGQRGPRPSGIWKDFRKETS